MTAIIGTFPYTLTNGTVADATQVQANFVYVQSQVNSNPPGTSFTDLFCTGTLTTAGGSGVSTILQFANGTAVNDHLSEMTYGASSKFTAATAGSYLFTADVLLEAAAGTTGIANTSQLIYVAKNNSVFTIVSQLYWPFASSTVSVFPVSVSYALSLGVGEYINVRMYPNYTGTALQGVLKGFTARRIA